MGNTCSSSTYNDWETVKEWNEKKPAKKPVVAPPTLSKRQESVSLNRIKSISSDVTVTNTYSFRIKTPRSQSKFKSSQLQ